MKIKGLKLIYEPAGAAKEYGDMALNIFDGCTHGCTYCYVPQVLKKDRPAFHDNVKLRKNNFFELLSKDLDRLENAHKHIFLCFTCDPFPYDRPDLWQVTVEVIAAIKTSGNHVVILTKGGIPEECYEYLDEYDIIGITVSCGDELARVEEPNALPPSKRIANLIETRQAVKELCGGRPPQTFVSCEPVLEVKAVYDLINDFSFIDEYRIGKLNYRKSDIDWTWFGRECVRLCEQHGKKYMIKKSLLEEMKK